MKALNTILGLACAAALWAPHARADDASPPQTLYGGSFVTPQKNVADSLLDYRGKDGAQVTAEAVEHWDGKKGQFALGCVTPLLYDRIHLTALGDTTGDRRIWKAGGFISYNLESGPTLRAGGFGRGQNGLHTEGGSLGGSYTNNKLTLDLDGIVERHRTEVHGFGAVVLEDGLYLGGGINTGRNQVNFVGGWIDPNSLGLYTQISIDLNQQTESGKVIFADKLTWGKGVFDFRGHVLSQTGTDIVSPILDSWLPIDGFATQRFALSVNWSHDKDVTTIMPELWVRPLPDTLIGLGYKMTLPSEGPIEGIVQVDGRACIPGTPFDAGPTLYIDTKSGAFSADLYAGITLKF